MMPFFDESICRQSNKAATSPTLVEKGLTLSEFGY